MALPHITTQNTCLLHFYIYTDEQSSEKEEKEGRGEIRNGYMLFEV